LLRSSCSPSSWAGWGFAINYCGCDRPLYVLVILARRFAVAWAKRIGGVVGYGWLRGPGGLNPALSHPANLAPGAVLRPRSSSDRGGEGVPRRFVVPSGQPVRQSRWINKRLGVGGSAAPDRQELGRPNVRPAAASAPRSRPGPVGLSMKSPTRDMSRITGRLLAAASEEAVPSKPLARGDGRVRPGTLTDHLAAVAFHRERMAWARGHSALLRGSGADGADSHRRIRMPGT